MLPGVWLHTVCAICILQSSAATEYNEIAGSDRMVGKANGEPKKTEQDKASTLCPSRDCVATTPVNTPTLYTPTVPVLPLPETPTAEVEDEDVVPTVPADPLPRPTLNISNVCNGSALVDTDREVCLKCIQSKFRDGANARVRRQRSTTDRALTGKSENIRCTTTTSSCVERTKKTSSAVYLPASPLTDSEWHVGFCYNGTRLDDVYAVDCLTSDMASEFSSSSQPIFLHDVNHIQISTRLTVIRGGKGKYDRASSGTHPSNVITLGKAYRVVAHPTDTWLRRCRHVLTSYTTRVWLIGNNGEEVDGELSWNLRSRKPPHEYLIFDAPRASNVSLVTIGFIFTFKVVTGTKTVWMSNQTFFVQHP